MENFIFDLQRFAENYVVVTGVAANEDGSIKQPVEYVAHPMKSGGDSVQGIDGVTATINNSGNITLKKDNADFALESGDTITVVNNIPTGTGNVSVVSYGGIKLWTIVNKVDRKKRRNFLVVIEKSRFKIIW